MNSQSTLLQPLVNACCSRFPSLLIFVLLSLSVSPHVPCFSFSSDAGSWAERMPSSECVSGSVRFIAYGGMKSLQSPKAHWAPLYPDAEPSSLFLRTLSLSPSFVFALRGGVFVGIMGACMCDSSQLVAHPSVPTATFIPTSEPSVHQSLCPSVLLRRVTDTQRR